MSQEELLLEQWRYLPTQERAAVINFVEFLRYKKVQRFKKTLTMADPNI